MSATERIDTTTRAAADMEKDSRPPSPKPVNAYPAA